MTTFWVENRNLKTKIKFVILTYRLELVVTVYIGILKRCSRAGLIGCRKVNAIAFKYINFLNGGCEKNLFLAQKQENYTESNKLHQMFHNHE